MDSLLPDEIVLKIFSYLDKRELCKCACVSRRWNALSYSDELWHEFSLTVIKSPKWCASKLISIENTNYLIASRFSESITRVDLSKMCFSFDTLDTLFQHCRHIASLCINFKYLQIRHTLKFHVSQCAVDKWPQNTLESLYLKNVCDMKTRRYQSKVGTSTTSVHTPTSYDLIEMEIIKLIRVLFGLNASSLRVLGLKCVDPNVISSCVNDFGQLHVLLLNNINDTDSVLQELAGVCRHLKCLELNKCREFEGDGLQDVVDQCSRLETLQIGKHVYPTLTELNEINWSNLKHHLKELSITTKFQETDKYLSSSSSSSTCSSSGCSSNSSNSPIDLYSSTIFNYLNDSNHLEYLALADFTLRFPVEHDKFSESATVAKRSNYTATQRKRKKRRIEDVDDDEDEDQEDDDDEDEENDDQVEIIPSRRSHNQTAPSNLKYLFLRNIRNIKTLTSGQIDNLRSFLQVQFNLHTLDLIGLYIDSKFICSILDNLNSLKVLYFGHGKSYKKNLASVKYLSKINAPMSHYDTYNYKYIDIDQINYKLAESCPLLTHFGIFYRQFELKFKKDPHIESKNESLLNLLQKCSQLREISYLKSFKIQEDDCDEEEEDESEISSSSSSNHQTTDDTDDDLDDSDDDKKKINEANKTSSTKGSKRKCRSYFRFIKYAIESVNPRVNMKPCYGFDITPSSGHFLDFANREFIETSLPPIRPPHNDFHTHLLR